MVLIDEPMVTLYNSHVDQVKDLWQSQMQIQQQDAVLIAAGEPKPLLFDDQSTPFRANPWFLHWLPLSNRPGSFVLITASADKPVLFYYQPRDIWHQISALSDDTIHQRFDVQVFSCEAELLSQLAAYPTLAYIGDPDCAPAKAGLSCNPEPLLTAMDFYRACKTPYEIECLRRANHIAVRGHKAVRSLFASGASEFDCHLAYLSACQQSDEQLPYPSIVAGDHHGAVLHYQNKVRGQSIAASLLIDAGASYNGYGADITRTWTRDPEFAELIDAMESLQLQLAAQVVPGQNFVELHLQAHRRLAELLVEQQLLLCTPEAALEMGLTSVFLPHGLGHLLGLQVHDRGGWQYNPEGDQQPPPEQHPYLRCTRVLEEGMVVTIEPGLYFIDALLQPWREAAQRTLFNWQKIERLAAFGGIRIEDNVAVVNGAADNLTRQAFAAIA